MWQCINRVLHPNPKRIEADPDELNSHFNTTAQKLTNSNPTSENELKHFIKGICKFDGANEQFEIKPVTFEEVLNGLKSLRSDCSSGYDAIPVQLIKRVANLLASPLTHLINSGIENQMFHKAWKIGKISPIPKSDNPTSNDDYRPITVLPILSKVYERLVSIQIL